MTEEELRRLENKAALTYADRQLLVAEVRRLCQQIQGYAARIAAQSELLSQRAEK